jgi:hypothetical protein
LFSLKGKRHFRSEYGLYKTFVLNAFIHVRSSRASAPENRQQPKTQAKSKGGQNAISFSSRSLNVFDVLYLRLIFPPPSKQRNVIPISKRRSIRGASGNTIFI